MCEELRLGHGQRKAGLEVGGSVRCGRPSPRPGSDVALLGQHARSAVAVVTRPIAGGLARTGVTPDVLTVLGTVGTCAAALSLFPTGHRFAGSVVVTLFALTDMLDGALARLTGRVSLFGAFLDSTLDRVSDAAIFVGIALWYAGRGDDLLLVAMCLYCLVAGSIVSYARARAEGLGMTADVGLAERTERLIVILFGVGLDGIGVPFALAAALWLLALAATITVGQRMATVWRQAAAAAAPPLP